MKRLLTLLIVIGAVILSDTISDAAAKEAPSRNVIPLCQPSLQHTMSM
jgi:hypothetical protein